MMDRRKAGWSAVALAAVTAVVGAGYLVSVNVGNDNDITEVGDVTISDDHSRSVTQGDTIINNPVEVVTVETEKTVVVEREVTPAWTPTPEGTASSAATAVPEPTPTATAASSSTPTTVPPTPKETLEPTRTPTPDDEPEPSPRPDPSPTATSTPASEPIPTEIVEIEVPADVPAEYRCIYIGLMSKENGDELLGVLMEEVEPTVEQLLEISAVFDSCPPIPDDFEGPELSTPAPEPTAETIVQEVTTPESADPVAAEPGEVPPATYHEEIVDLTNRRRDAGGWCGEYESLGLASHEYPPGARALTVDDVLSSSAQSHAEHMAATGEFEHQAIEALREVGANGENIGVFWGPLPVAETFVQGWIESPGHCHNLMTPGWEEIGVGVAQASNGDWFGVQLFRGSRISIEVDSGGDPVSAINAIAALSVEERLEVFRWAIEETWREVQYSAMQAEDHSCRGVPLDKVRSAEVRFAYAEDPTAGPRYFEQEFPAQYATLVLEPDLWGISTDPAQFVGCDQYTRAVWIAAVYGGSAAIGVIEE